MLGNKSGVSEPVVTSSGSSSDSRLAAVESRLEDVLDYLYGTNVRPPLTARTEHDYAAEQRSDNLDDSARKEG